MQNLATMIQQRTIKKVFNQRSDFIVIGLIGPIGSNLSSAVEIFSSDFEEINLAEQSLSENCIENLEYRNVYQFAKNNWKRFDVIKARDAIISYILENTETYNRFQKDIQQDIFKDSKFSLKCVNDITALQNNLKEQYVDKDQVCLELKNIANRICTHGLYEELHARNEELKLYIDVLRTKSGSEYNTRTTFTLYVYTKYILPIIGSNIKKTLSLELYTSIFQKYGNEIRFFGTLDVNEWVNRLTDIESISNFDYCYSIAKRINTFIKIRRQPSSNKKSIPVQIVIDSLKNPYEFNFLRDRYSAYYTFALVKNKEEQETANEIFSPDRYSVLYENPNFIKKEFNNFINLLIECTQREKTYIAGTTYEYIQSLRTPDIFINYILDILRRYKKEENLNRIFPEINYIEYNQEFARIGILENEYKYFFDVLRDPIRTFCMISGLFVFYLQDIQNSTQNADVFLDNSEETYGKRNLKYQIVKYVSLIMHPGLVPPTKIERCMQIAYSAKVNSGCISRQVGAVVTDKDYNILSIGWNDVPCGRVPCVYRDLINLRNNPIETVYSDLERGKSQLFRNYIEKYDFTNTKKIDKLCSGVPLSYCFKSEYSKVTHERAQENSRSMHGEERAFHLCGNKMLAKGGCLFTTSSSCERCTIIANEYGIKKIYYIENYPGISQVHVNASGEEKVRAEFILYKGVIGASYVKLYTPILPMKDELQLRGISELHN